MTPEPFPIHRVGIGTDLHQLGPGRRLVLGGVAIPHESGLVGHSDADVVIHALIDGILGAAGLGDIGEHFPDSDPQYRDVDSGELLGKALAEVRAAGWQIVNVDLTIHAERPRLSVYKNAIRGNLAQRLALSPESVGVKAKTNEGVDAVGRGEAIACTCVVGLSAIRD